MMSTTATRHRFAVTDFERMADVGILRDEDRVELIAGEIIEMSPIGARHVACVLALTELLSGSMRPDVVVSVQNPIRLTQESQPQPDIAVLRRRSYHDRLPTAADALLVIEVADRSVDYDRTIKFPLYAAAGIAEAWLADLAVGRIERHTMPSAGGYRQMAWPGLGNTLDSSVLPAVVIPVSPILASE